MPYFTFDSGWKVFLEFRFLTICVQILMMTSSIIQAYKRNKQTHCYIWNNYNYWQSEEIILMHTFTINTKTPLVIYFCSSQSITCLLMTRLMNHYVPRDSKNGHPTKARIFYGLYCDLDAWDSMVYTCIIFHLSISWLSCIINFWLIHYFLQPFSIITL